MAASRRRCGEKGRDLALGADRASRTYPMQLRFVVLVVLAAVLASAASCEAGECAGSLAVTLPVAAEIQNVEIIWNREIVVNECDGTHVGPILYEKTADALIVNDGGFGYTPPSHFSLRVNDLKDCTADPERIVDVTNRAVEGADKLCTAAQVDL